MRKKAQGVYVPFCIFAGMAKTKTRKRERRLQSAEEWIKTYTGKHLVKGYAKHYAVDLICAIVELRKLGVVISDEYETAVKRSMADKVLQQKKRKEAKAGQSELIDDTSDAHFAYIAGYTSGGAPYGITWEQMKRMDVADS
jgi:hypothetical protein